MGHLLAGPYFGPKWKIVLDAQCQAGGFGEFLIATNWLVLQLGERSPYTQNGWSNFAMGHLLAGPYFGREWKIVLDAQCQSGGFDEFLIVAMMNWLVHDVPTEKR